MFANGLRPVMNGHRINGAQANHAGLTGTLHSSPPCQITGLSYHAAGMSQYFVGLGPQSGLAPLPLKDLDTNSTF